MLSSRVVLSVGSTTSWLTRLLSSPSMPPRKSGAFTPADQTRISAGTTRPLAPHLALRQLDHPLARADPHAETLQLVQRRLLQPLRQGREDGWGRLDQRDPDVPFRVDAVEGVGDELARRLVQLGRELDAGGARADDRDLELALAQGPLLVLGPQAGVEQALLHLLGLDVGVEEHAVLLDPRRAEVVADAADRDHQR